MRKAHFLFSKGGTDPTPWGVVSQGTKGAGNSATQKFPPVGGEIPKRRRTRAAIRGFGTNPFLLWQTLRSRFAAEKNSVKRNFAKPMLLSLRLHAQRKSGQTFLCNFYLICLLSTTSNNRSGGCSAPPGPFDQRAARP